MLSDPRSNDLPPAEIGDARILRGKGGETHQTADAGCPRADDAAGRAGRRRPNSLKAGARGPTLMEDQHSAKRSFI
jgi:catalase